MPDCRLWAYTASTSIDRECPIAQEGVFCRKPRLTTLRGVRREFGALYLDLLHGRVPQKTAGTAAGLLTGIVRALEAELLEARLEALEERAGIRGPRRTNISMPRLTLQGPGRHA
jgi:hypothetical protein